MKKHCVPDPRKSFHPSPFILDPSLRWLPWAVGALCVAAFAAWQALDAPREEAPRVPIEWDRTTGTSDKPGRQVGEVTTVGPGRAADLPGSWPQFRGAQRDNIVDSSVTLARAWPEAGPPLLWRLPVGEGFAGAAIHKGMAYLIDYDREQQLDVIRCLSLDDGQEVWRTTYPVTVKRNHGMTRTVPAVTDEYVVTLGPRCHVYCCDARTGRVIWKLDLKKDYGTVEPPWYAGQCPLIDGGRVILAPGGKPLMMAVELATGEIAWRTAGHEDMGMTHSSIAPALLGGVKQYVYGAHEGVVGVAADDGRVLWTWPQWKINMANIPTPLAVGPDRLFFTGGYGSGSQMVRLVPEDKEAGKAFKVEEVFRLKATEFAADQQTPILFQDHLYAIIPPSTAGEAACLNLDGRRLWTSGGERRFGYGPFLMTRDGLMLALGEDGTLHLAKVGPAGYEELAQAKVLSGGEAWGPMALADGRLVLRDLTEMICLDLRQ